MQTREDLAQWDGQSPPRPSIPKIYEGKHLPKFGPYQQERNKLRKQDALSKDLLEKDTPAPHPESAIPAPTVNSQIGRAVPRIGDYNSLNNKEQVVALVDEELCINCGKCYMTCNDSGYQAITFDAHTHLPHVTDDCTGCTLCVSVCPILDCITMVPRTIPYIPNRGVPVKAT